MSQFDFSFNQMTAPNPTMKRNSGFDHYHAQTATGGSGSGNYHIPFNLSPLNEFDEIYEDPLNKAMILDQSLSLSSCGGDSVWSKHRHLDAKDNEEANLTDLLLPQLTSDDIVLKQPPRPQSFPAFSSKHQPMNIVSPDQLCHDTT